MVENERIIVVLDELLTDRVLEVGPRWIKVESP